MRSITNNRNFTLKHLDGYYPHSWGKGDLEYSSTSCTVECLDKYQYDWMVVHRDVQIDPNRITTSTKIMLTDPDLIRAIVTREEALAKHIAAAKVSIRSAPRS